MRSRFSMILLFFGMALAGSAFAQDRAGFIGQSLVFPLQFAPTQGRGNEAYAVDFGYFFTDEWLGVLSWEFALRGPERVNLSVGPRYMFRPYGRFRPYLGGEFLYLVDPTNDLGWRGFVGFEYNLFAVTGLDNLRVTAHTGLAGIAHIGHADELSLEWVRIGLSWSY